MHATVDDWVRKHAVGELTACGAIVQPAPFAGPPALFGARSVQDRKRGSVLREFN